MSLDRLLARRDKFEVLLEKAKTVEGRYKYRKRLNKALRKLIKYDKDKEKS